MDKQFKDTTLGFLTYIQNDKGTRFFTKINKDELVSKFSKLIDDIPSDEVNVVLNVRQKDGKMFGVLNLFGTAGAAAPRAASKASKVVDLKDI